MKGYLKNSWVQEGYINGEKNEFLEQIELKRNELINIVAKDGLNSKVAIEYSQQLDQLLNKYNELFYKTGIDF
ncbi:aspartyl-phosphate phosphatase Spo0E family protein [Peribacillus sp. TH24]|uniref:aspartyl-phosphate phosphatase Spo0E family protein n=1 Tax=Peribacillus sp. TH24 TaxID=2798483 RepID=UPI0028BECB59|nr:aspartyl-phosphate phosphatase Spo0E family protein [Peribacillus sp. TH24]